MLNTGCVYCLCICSVCYTGCVSTGVFVVCVLYRLHVFSVYLCVMQVACIVCVFVVCVIQVACIQVLWGRIH